MRLEQISDDRARTPFLLRLSRYEHESPSENNIPGNPRALANRSQARCLRARSAGSQLPPAGHCPGEATSLCTRELRSSRPQWIRFQRGTCALDVFIAGHRKRVRVVSEIPCPYRHARHDPAVVTGASAIHSRKRVIGDPALTAQGPVRIGGMLDFRAWGGIADRIIQIPGIAFCLLITGYGLHRYETAPSAIRIR